MHTKLAMVFGIFCEELREGKCSAALNHEMERGNVPSVSKTVSLWTIYILLLIIEILLGIALPVFAFVLFITKKNN